MEQTAPEPEAPAPGASQSLGALIRNQPLHDHLREVPRSGGRGPLVPQSTGGPVPSQVPVQPSSRPAPALHLLGHRVAGKFVNPAGFQETPPPPHPTGSNGMTLRFPKGKLRLGEYGTSKQSWDGGQRPVEVRFPSLAVPSPSLPPLFGLMAEWLEPRCNKRGSSPPLLRLETPPLCWS